LENPRKSWIFGHCRFAEAYRKGLGCGGDTSAAKRDFPGSDLEITSFGAMPGGTNVTVTWDSVLSRWYFLQERLDLNPSSLQPVVRQRTGTDCPGWREHQQDHRRYQRADALLSRPGCAPVVTMRTEAQS